MAIDGINSRAELESFIREAMDRAPRPVMVVFSGEGDPTGVVDAPIGVCWSRTDGAPGATFYVQEGPGTSDWVAK